MDATAAVLFATCIVCASAAAVWVALLFSGGVMIGVSVDADILVRCNGRTFRAMELTMLPPLDGSDSSTRIAPPLDGSVNSTRLLKLPRMPGLPLTGMVFVP